MRISDWSSDVCSSDLERAITLGQIADILQARGDLDGALRIRHEDELPIYEKLGDVRSQAITLGRIADVLQARGDLDEIGRGARRERVWQYVLISGVATSFKTKLNNRKLNKQKR